MSQVRVHNFSISLDGYGTGDGITFDFTGTDAQSEGNVNAVEAVTVSSVAFAVRAGTDPSLPANGGTLRPLTVIAPPGTIVLNAYNQVLPKFIGDALGPTKTDAITGKIVPRVGRDTGSGYSDTQLKLDDSPAAAANFATDVALLVTATATAKDARGGRRHARSRSTTRDRTVSPRSALGRCRIVYPATRR
jgi:hypothetical protein